MTVLALVSAAPARQPTAPPTTGSTFTVTGDVSTELTLTVLVTATDGYRSVVAWAEFDPDFAGTEVLLAYREDGQRLDRPQLVVPGDKKGGRYVSDVTEVQLTGQP